MNIEGFMKRKVVPSRKNATIADAARLFVEKHVGILPSCGFAGNTTWRDQVVHFIFT